MNWNLILFSIFPYLALIIAIVVGIYRSVYRPFSISSLSSQLLENKQLYWGSIPFHWGIVLILLVHLLAIFFPRSLLLWNAQPLRLYLLEFTGLALGVWSLAGLGVLVWRRLSQPRVQAVTSFMDILILVLLLVSVISGVIVATAYRFGSYWFSGIFTPYLLSLLVLQPRLDLITPLPLMIKLHVLNFFILLLIMPFSRLVHIFTYPFGYLIRPWQIVIWYRKRGSETRPS